MGAVTVSIDADDAIAALIAWAEREKVATLRGVQKSGEFLQSQARLNFEGIHPYGYPHDPFGAEGDRPNIVSGHLQESIVVSPVVPEGAGRFTVQVGPTAIYGRITELGGIIVKDPGYMSWFSPWLGRQMYRHDVTLHPHPFMKPGYDTTRDHMNSIMSDEWTAAIYE